MLTTVAVADKLGARLVQIACYGYLRTCAYSLEHYHCPLHMSRREKEEHFQHEAEHLAKASQALERLCLTVAQHPAQSACRALARILLRPAGRRQDLCQEVSGFALRSRRGRSLRIAAEAQQGDLEHMLARAREERIISACPH